jgi:ABC-type bacteriocin/lantibiotic exporter with double-glycine peptidase domain
MLLDEVTSALDPATEQQVLENLSRLGVTTIVTTHRPSVLDMCQRIYEVRDGLVTRLDT